MWKKIHAQVIDESRVELIHLLKDINSPPASMTTFWISPHFFGVNSAGSVAFIWKGGYDKWYKICPKPLGK